MLVSDRKMRLRLRDEYWSRGQSSSGSRSASSARTAG